MPAKKARKSLALAVLLASTCLCLCLGCRIVTPEDGLFQIEAPNITPASGTVSASPVEFGVASMWYSDVDIRYTSDGSDPTSASTPLATDLTISSGQAFTLKFRAFKDGYKPSDIVTRTYSRP